MAFRTTFAGLKITIQVSRHKAALNVVASSAGNTRGSATYNQRRSGIPTFKKKFKGDCRICGNKCHKSADCWVNPAIVINILQTGQVNVQKQHKIQKITTKVVLK